MFRKSVPLAVLAFLAAVFSSVHAGAQELTQNGGFETGTFAGWTQFPTGAGQQTITSTNPASGTFAAEINNGVIRSNSLIKQANLGVGIVTPGETINISFDARGSFPVGGVAFAEFFSELSGGGTSKSEILGGAPLAVNSNPNIWTHFIFTTTAGTNVSGGVTLQLGATNGADPGTHVWYDNVSVAVNTVTVSGTITLQGCTVAQPITLQFIRSDGSLVLNRTASSGSAYTMPCIPPGTYTLHIKGAKSLAKNIIVNATNGNVSGVTATLLAGDANNDNVVDISDLLLLIAHYNQVSPSAGYLEAADFTCDGTNDIADLLLLIGNYNKLGD